MARRVGFSGGVSRSATGSVWQKHLLPNEEIIWEGNPGFGFSINKNAILTLVTVAIGIFFLAPQILTADQFGSLLTVPFINYRVDPVWFIGLAIGWTVVWFLMRTVTVPWFSRYMLSDQRAFIRNLWGRIKSYDLDPMRVIEFNGRTNGNIIFASEVRRTNNGKKRTFPVGFMHVKGAQEIYQKMVKIQRSKVNNE